MKSNKNPLYLLEIGTVFDNGPYTANGTPGVYSAIRGTLGVGSKYLKDTRMLQRILAEFPEPMKLREFLYNLPSDEAKQIAQRISPNMTEKQYKFLIRRYVLKGSLLRYILHGIGGDFSAIGNTVNAVDNEMNDVKTVIRNNLT